MAEARARDGHRADLPDLRAHSGRTVLQQRRGARPRRRAHRQVPQVEHPVHGPRRAATSRAGTRSSTSSPAISAFPTFDTPFGRIGILICYDRHFPEAARILGLGGAEIVFVPTATTRHDALPLGPRAARHAVDQHLLRLRREQGRRRRRRIDAQPFRQQPGHAIRAARSSRRRATRGEDIALADVDLSVIPELRALWGYYRDRRPDLYGAADRAAPRARDSGVAGALDRSHGDRHVALRAAEHRLLSHARAAEGLRDGRRHADPSRRGIRLVWPDELVRGDPAIGVFDGDTNAEANGSVGDGRLDDVDGLQHVRENPRAPRVGLGRPCARRPRPAPVEPRVAGGRDGQRGVTTRERFPARRGWARRPS